MKVTNEMIHKAVKQAVKDNVLPTHACMDTYTNHYECVRRMLQAALDSEIN